MRDGGIASKRTGRKKEIQWKGEGGQKDLEYCLRGGLSSGHLSPQKTAKGTSVHSQNTKGGEGKEGHQGKISKGRSDKEYGLH